MGKSRNKQPASDVGASEASQSDPQVPNPNGPAHAAYMKGEYVTLLQDSGLSILGYMAVSPGGGGGQHRDRYPGRAVFFPVVIGFDHKVPRADLRARLAKEGGWMGWVVLMDKLDGRTAMIEFSDEAEVEMDEAEKSAAK